MLLNPSGAHSASWWQKKYGPGVSDAGIKIGNTMPYSSPASSYSNVGKAMSAYFDKRKTAAHFFESCASQSGRSSAQQLH
jgi:hypothetical protein